MFVTIIHGSLCILYTPLIARSATNSLLLAIFKRRDRLSDKGSLRGKIIIWIVGVSRIIIGRSVLLIQNTQTHAHITCSNPTRTPLLIVTLNWRHLLLIIIEMVELLELLHLSVALRIIVQDKGVWVVLSIFAEIVRTDKVGFLRGRFRSLCRRSIAV